MVENTLSVDRPEPLARTRQAVILVGGKGTRLGELTKATPKPLMPIGDDRVFLDLLIDNIARQGFDEILLLAGYLGDQVVDRYDARTIRGALISVLIEPEPMGTGGALRFAAGHLRDNFLLTNGDTYFDINYRALEQAFCRGDTLGILALRQVDDCARYGSIDVDADGKIRSFREKSAVTQPMPGLINGGVYLLDRAILDHLPRGPSSLEQDVFPALASSNRLRGLDFPGYFIDIGLPETLEQARQDLPNAIRRPALFLDRDGVINHDHGYVHRWDQFDWVEDARQLIRLFNDSGWFVFVVTNQAGVAHGYYDEPRVHRLHDVIRNSLAAEGAFIDGFYHCPYHPAAKVDRYRADAHEDRKPAPGMILRAFAEWPIDRAGSFIVVDRDIDVMAGEAAGISGMLFPGGSLYTFIENQGCLPAIS